MGNAYIFSLQPTFTQGLILGQFSILFLLVLVLKYLFFDPVATQPYKVTSYQPRIASDDGASPGFSGSREGQTVADGGHGKAVGVESADWLNILLHQVGTIERSLVFRE